MTPFPELILKIDTSMLERTRRGRTSQGPGGVTMWAGSQGWASASCRTRWEGHVPRSVSSLLRLKAIVSEAELEKGQE